MSFDAVPKLCENLISRIDDFEKEISRRLPEMCATETRIFYDDLLSMRRDLVSIEERISGYKYLISESTMNNLLEKIRKAYLKVTKLKVEFEKKKSSSKTNSTPPTNLKVDDQSNATKQPETLRNVDLQIRIRKQSLLIKQIESLQSLEILDDICAVKAEVIYNHLSQLYDSFTSEQIQIEASLDDDATLLDNQQKIAADIQRKVIDFQTKMKKIMQPTSSTECKINNDHSSQPEPAQADTEAKLKFLLDKQFVLLTRIESLNPEKNKDVSPEKAEILYNRLTMIGELSDLNQIEIESLDNDNKAEYHQRFSEKMQKNVFKYQETYKKIFAPITLPSSTQLKKRTSPSEEIKSSESKSDPQAIERKLIERTALYYNLMQDYLKIGTFLVDHPTQKHLSEEIRQTVLRHQTHMEEMTELVEPKIAAEMAESKFDIDFDLSSQSTSIDNESTLEFLYKKRDSLIEAISLLEPKEDVGPEKAEIMYNHLNSLYESFNSNQTEIETQVSGITLESQFVISRLIRNRVIELQTTFKKIFAPIITDTESSKQLEKHTLIPTSQINSPELESELGEMKLMKLTDLFMSLCQTLLKSQSKGDETRNNISDIFTSLNGYVEVSKDIQTKVLSLQNTLSKFIDENKRSGESIHQKLDDIMENVECLE
ncbi:uncharacterized protein LOC135842822 [Planococcus citri]|uniref:uncharacterized protein LOC135842822 n=1 Tax=Planococcus citri TaxID=170843 RepID=UPI0031F733D7